MIRTSRRHPAPPPAPPAAPPAAPAPVAAVPITVQILQTNRNPQYGTVRTLEYQAGVGFCFDNSTPPTPWTPLWIPITDSAITAQLTTLGTMTGSNFSPTIGAMCSYTLHT